MRAAVDSTAGMEVRCRHGEALHTRAPSVAVIACFDGAIDQCDRVSVSRSKRAGGTKAPTRTSPPEGLMGRPTDTVSDRGPTRRHRSGSQFAPNHVAGSAPESTEDSQRTFKSIGAGSVWELLSGARHGLSNALGRPGRGCLSDRSRPVGDLNHNALGPGLCLRDTSGLGRPVGMAASELRFTRV